MKIAIKVPMMNHGVGTMFGVVYICKIHNSYTVEHEYGWRPSDNEGFMCIYCTNFNGGIKADTSTLTKKYFTISGENCTVIDGPIDMAIKYLNTLL